MAQISRRKTTTWLSSKNVGLQVTVFCFVATIMFVQIYTPWSGNNQTGSDVSWLLQAADSSHDGGGSYTGNDSNGMLEMDQKHQTSPEEKQDGNGSIQNDSTSESKDLDTKQTQQASEDESVDEINLHSSTTDQVGFGETISETSDKSDKSDGDNNIDNNLPFSGTRITRLSQAMDLYENVCIDRTGSNKIPIVRSYTEKGQTLYHTSYQRYRQGNEVFMTKTQGHALAQWNTDVAASSHGVVPFETVWTLSMYENPAHCLTDVAFTLAMDRYQRLAIVGDNKKPFYDHYLMGTWKGFYFGPYDATKKYAWCYEMLGSLDLINPTEGIVNVPKPMTCFRKLLVPTVRMQRFPLSRIEDNEAVEHYLRFTERFEHGFKEAELNYPKEILWDMRRRAAANLGLSIEPWPGSSMTVSEDKVILLHVRAPKQRRKLLNAAELKEVLETNYHTNVTLLSEAWLPLKFHEQMQVYNRFPQIITAHGAHMANALVCRPNTKLIELFCHKNRDMYPDTSLTERGHDTSYVHWWGGSNMNWFESFTRRLDIRHFTQGQRDCSGHGSDIVINTTQVLHLIVNRFGLVPRGSSQ